MERDWVDDGLDVRAALSEALDLRAEGRLEREKTSELIAKHTYWADFRQRAVADR